MHLLKMWSFFSDANERKRDFVNSETLKKAIWIRFKQTQYTLHSTATTTTPAYITCSENYAIPIRLFSSRPSSPWSFVLVCSVYWDCLIRLMMHMVCQY